MSGNDTLVNGRSPVTKVSSGTTTKFPDVCKTPVGRAIVPIHIRMLPRAAVWPRAGKQ